MRPMTDTHDSPGDRPGDTPRGAAADTPPAVALLPILVVPDRMLKERARAVRPEDMEAVRALLPGMFATMYDAPGIGLAAPQVGVNLRLAVVDLMPDETPAPLVLVNPKVVAVSDELATREEGCLSLPGQYADVTRPARVSVRFHDVDGRQQEIHADGLLAACLQHELDHLDGVLFVDHISSLKRNMLLRRLAKERKQKAQAVSEAPPRRTCRRAPAGRLPRQPGLRRAHAARTGGGRARGRRGLQPAAPPRRTRPGAPPLPGARGGRGAGPAGPHPRPLRRDPEAQAAFAALGLDVAVVAAYGLILPQAMLDAPARGCLNVHASLLPRWRGAAPIHAALLAGDAQTGITIMQMDAGLDTGATLAPRGRRHRPRHHLPRAARPPGGAGRGTAATHPGRASAAVPQPADGVTYAGRLTREDGRIDWAADAQAVLPQCGR